MKNICRPKPPGAKFLDWQMGFPEIIPGEMKGISVGLLRRLLPVTCCFFCVSNYEVVKVGSEKKWNEDVETGNGRNHKVTP